LGFYNTNIEKDLKSKDSSKESVIESILKGYSQRKWDYLPPLKETGLNNKPK
jgi:myo-inositol-1-phosphate synthase